MVPLEAPLKWLDRLEGPLGFLAIPRIILFIVVGQALATIAAFQHPQLSLQMLMDPVAIASGQYWRVISWVMVPFTGRIDPFLSIFWFWFLWMIGSALEAEWGAFKCTVYVLLGVVLPPLGALFLYHYFGIITVFSGFYFATSMQLAFAALAPEFTIYLMLILPVKMRWWAWALGAYLIFQAFGNGLAGFLETGFGVGNYLVFFLPGAWSAFRLRKQVAENRKVFVAAKREAHALDLRACAECGAGPEADLRLCFCDRCGEDGRHWCAAHLPAHLGKAAPPPAPAAEPSPPPPKKLGKPPKAKTKRKG